jgi:hypothetical protein
LSVGGWTNLSRSSIVPIDKLIKKDPGKVNLRRKENETNNNG